MRAACLLLVMTVVLAFATPALGAAMIVTVDATRPGRAIGADQLGVNTGMYSELDRALWTDRLHEAGLRVLRFPGGSEADEWHWQQNRDERRNLTGATSWDAFVAAYQAAGARDAIITVNYGSGTADEAAAWVRDANITRKLGIKRWEVGNEVYGPWEYDKHDKPHDPATYVSAFVDYARQMKAVDPTIAVGAVTIGTGDFNGWTITVLRALKAAGARPDFVVVHVYPQQPKQETDAGLLGDGRPSVLVRHVDYVRSGLSSVFGADGDAIQILVTELNSCWPPVGKQTLSLVNALFFAISYGELLGTTASHLSWFNFNQTNVDLERGGNEDASLYGWRSGGTYAMVGNGGGERFPTFYAAKLLAAFTGDGGRVLPVTGNAGALRAFALGRGDRGAAVLLVNTSPAQAIDAQLAFTGLRVQGTVTAHTFGKAQDEAARTGKDDAARDVAVTITDGTLTFSLPPYSMTVVEAAGEVVTTAPQGGTGGMAGRPPDEAGTYTPGESTGGAGGAAPPAPPGHGPGCAVVGGGGAGWLLALVALYLRRRR